MGRTHLRWIVLLLSAVIAAAILTWLFWPRPLGVDTAVVGRGPIADVVSDQGTARVRQAYVVSAPVTGRLERLPVEVGDRVAANETVVARLRPAAPELLDPRTRAQAVSAVEAARAALAAATAQRDRLAADVTRTADQLRRMTDLARQRVVSPQELDNATADATAAANALRAADADILTRRANVVSAEAALTDPQAGSARAIAVTSPASGVVTRLLQQSERTVTSGTPLVEIGDTSGLEAAIEFLSQDAVKIQPGQYAEIYDWGGPDDIPAEVRRIEPQGFTKVSALGVEEQRTLVYLQFTAPPSAWAGLAPGYRTWGRVHLRRQPSAVLVPLGALVRDSGNWAVYRLEQGRARLRPVQLGTMNERDAEVLGGATPGDVVVLYPSDQIRDGVRIDPRR